MPDRKPDPSPIAIVGMAGRFPGARDLAAFWRNLRDGVESITTLDDEALRAAGVDPATLCPEYVRAAAILDDLDLFDAEFFGLSRKEAELLDPQHRLLLECAWEALENAGHSPADPPGPIGCFAGGGESGYVRHFMPPPRLSGENTVMDDWMNHGSNTPGMLATRVSYKLDLRGPSLTVQTACSTSLVAVHMACQSLLARDCDLALAGGVCIPVPSTGYAYNEGMIFSPDGHTRAFDARAQGTLFGAGLGMVVLRRLEDALADGDRVHAVILGTGVNNDGRGPKSAFTAPSVEGQVGAIARAVAAAGVSPETISYVEAHGTATRAGDGVEVAALTQAWRLHTAARGWCAIGSVKTNIGHAVEAAGVAGLIKTALMLKHRKIVPNLHCDEPHPDIGFEETPFRVATKLEDWNPPGPRRAGVSSFGVGGTNAHAILEEAPPTARPATSPDRGHHIFCLSARSESALRELAGRHARHLATHPELELGDVCFTANVGRSHFPHRLATVVQTREELGDRLGSWAAGQHTPAVHVGHTDGVRPPRVAFAFTGQGAQYPGMGRGLVQVEPSFRQILEHCSELLGELDPPLLAALAPQDGASTLLDEPQYLQPAAYAVQCGLAQLLRQWGVEPSAVIGHSLGEYAAAWLSGVFSLEAGLELVAIRGRLMQALPRDGAMVALSADADSVARQLAELGEGDVGVAALNTADSTVVSGRRTAVEAVVERFAAQGVEARALHVTHAFHSALMDPILEAFEAAARRISFGPARTPFVSSLTGKVGVSLDAAYWRRQLREPVRFHQAVQALPDCDVVLEIGARPVLTTLGRATLPEVAWIPTLDGRRDDGLALFDALAQLYVRGLNPHWRAVDEARGRRRVGLPTYAFERQRYWRELHVPDAASPSRPPAEGRHAWLGPRIPSPLPERQYEAVIDSGSVAMLGGHRIAGVPVFPAMGFLDLITWTAGDALQTREVVIRDLALHRPLPLPEQAECHMFVVIDEMQGGQAGVRIHARNGHDWTLHATAHLTSGGDPSATPDALESVRARCDQKIDIADLYRQRKVMGFDHDDGWSVIREAWVGENEVLGLLRLDEAVVGQVRRHAVHPVLLDAAGQLFDAGSDATGKPLRVPTAIDTVVVRGPLPTSAWAHMRARSGNRESDIVVADIDLCDEQGKPLVSMYGVTCKRIDPKALAALVAPAASRDAGIYRAAWRRRERGEARVPVEGRWLVFSDRGGVGEELQSLLEARGAECVRVVRGDHFDASQPGLIEIAQSDPEGYRRAFEATVGTERRVVHLWALDDNEDPGSVSARRPALESTLLLLRAHETVDTGDAGIGRLWLVTRGAQAVAAAPRPVAPAQATLWGLGRVAQLETADLRTQLVDLDPATPAAAAAVALLEELLTDDQEGQVALRAEARYAPRLAAREDAPEVQLRPPAENYALTTEEPGLLERLVLTPRERRVPGPGEIEIEVRAAGVNFRDVLVALGRLSGPLGRECSGIVVTCGEGVTRFRAGDAVMAVTDHAFSPRVVVDARYAAAKPSHLSHTAAATLPLTFLTAAYSLEELARLRSGESVLIHAGAGGVGLAAIQLAQRAGARVFATASQGKRPFLHQAGVEHVFDSRSLGFAADLKQATAGRGVDVVLNSLAGEFIPLSVESLTAQGRFIELGASGIWSAERVAALRPDVAYHAFQLGDPMRRDPEGFARVFDGLQAAFERGSLAPPPWRSWPLRAAVDAFRFMARGDHVGKLVLLPPDAEAEAHKSPRFRKDGTYLITGGTGALGLRIARWMAENGAGAVALLSRRGVLSDDARKALEAGGCRIHTFAADVADASSLRGALEQIRSSCPPLRGVIHAAGVLDDGVLSSQTWDRFAAVLAPKLAGAWNLHELTQGLPLDHFVLFSSVAALLGNPGQSNYAAANANLQALAHHRRSRGLATLSVDWGPWADGGMAMNEVAMRRWQESGIRLVEPDAGLRALGEALQNDECSIAVAPMNWPAYLRQCGPSGVPPLLEEVADSGRGPAPASLPTPRVALRDQLEQADPEARLGLLVLRVREEAARLLSCAVSSIEAERPLKHAGLDSLMAIELRNRLAKDIGVQLPMVHFLEGSSVTELSSSLLAELGSRSGGLKTPPVSRPASASDKPRQGDRAEPAGEDGDAFPLTPAQEQLWFVWRTEPSSSAYNSAFALQLDGDLDREALARALSEILRRHESLRSTMPRVGGRPVQRVQAASDVPLPFVDLSRLSHDAARQEAERLMVEGARQPFDLTSGPLFRAQLLRVADGEQLLACSTHHICFDGWSAVLFARELHWIYHELASGATLALADPKLRYRDYVASLRGELQGERLESLLAYWRERLVDPPPALELPTDHPRPPLIGTAGGVARRALATRLALDLGSLCRQEQITPFVGLLATLHVLLFGMTGQADQCIGMPFASRPESDVEGLLGMFVDTLVLRTDLSGDPTVRELLERVHETTLGAFAHPLPFQYLVQELRPRRRADRTPVFDVMLSVGRPAQGGFPIAPIDLGAAKFDLSFTMTEGPGALTAELEYRSELFEPGTAARILEDFEATLAAAVEAPGGRLSHLAAGVFGARTAR